MNRFLTIASSGLIASGLSLLPIAAFAQTQAQTPAPAKAATTVPAAPQNTAPATAPAKMAAPMTPSAAPATAPAMTGSAKSDMKATAHDGKTQVHGMNAAKTHHAGVKSPATSVQTKG